MESSSGGEIPALLNATSTLPWVSNAAANSASTCSGSVTSVLTKIPPVSSAAALPRVSSTSPQTTWAPSEASLRTAARPMPLPAPVTTAVRPTSLRQTMSSLTVRGPPCSMGCC